MARASEFSRKLGVQQESRGASYCRKDLIRRLIGVKHVTK